ncbi:MAG TPA: NAD(P)-dependent oxidoreductase [Gemmatimonadales bacterium]|nr:NAD(P)-dependent oxidoreductase [Gemmatimonadales bacterium]
MTVLVTGASGLVGSHVVAALRERGERVRALVRPASREVVAGLGAEAVVGDATDAGAWTRAAQGVDAIVHAAAIVGRRASWEAYLAANLEATRLATAAAADARARLVHLSSVAVYRGTAAYHVGAARRTEAEPFGPIPERDFYGRSKRMAEAVVREAAERGTIDAVALRPDVIYGERDRLFTPRVLGRSGARSSRRSAAGRTTSPACTRATSPPPPSPRSPPPPRPPRPRGGSGSTT